MNTWKLKENTLMERIRQHLLAGYEISDADNDILMRWEFAHSLIMKKENDTAVVKLMRKEFGIGQAQAYIDIRNAKDIFGDVRKSSKEGLRYMVTDWAISLLKKAEENDDYYAAAKALEKIIKANNLDKEDQDLPDPSKIQPPVQLLSINFTFINSPWFSKIDPKAQEGLLALYDQFMATIEGSPYKDYLNMFQQEQPIALPSPDDGN